jgi:hypothetical protein
MPTFEELVQVLPGPPNDGFCIMAGTQNTGEGSAAVFAQANGGKGVYAISAGFDAVVGETQSDMHAGVTGRNRTSGAKGGVGVYGVGGKFAGKFDGDVEINGNLHLSGAIIGEVVITQLLNRVTALEQQVAELKRHPIGG